MVWWILGIVSYLLGAYATVGLIIKQEGPRYGLPLVLALSMVMLWPCYLLVVAIDEVDDWDWQREIYGWMEKKDGGEG